MQITKRELADAIHVPYQGINELVNKKRGATPRSGAENVSLFRCFSRFLACSANQVGFE
jgi:hypothetical protein